MRMIIVGGGWSVSQYRLLDFTRFGTVVAVNEAAVLIPCDVAITMDRLWAEHRARQYFILNKGELWVRKGADKHLVQHPRLRQFDCCDRSVVMSDEPNVFNGTNSGTVALNYAYQQRPSQIYLFGFDMQKGPNDEPYWYPPYEWAPEGATKPRKYDTWAKEFASVAKQFSQRDISIKNVNHRSKIAAFAQISYQQFLGEVTC